MKKILTFLLAITVLFSSVDVSSINIYAADGTVKIFLEIVRHPDIIKR